MTVGRRQYNEAEMMRMQQEAEARVREMQSRARQAVEPPGGESGGSSSRNRNWSSNAGMSRPRNMRWPGPGGQRPQQQQQRRPQQPQREEKESTPEPEEPKQHDPAAHMAEDAPPEKKDGTIIGDIMGALNLDEDYLLIIGLILILINQRADTTLILALAYLLF